ncbi:MAG TPA: serine hydrolase [Vicinamibacterales bacterium]|nr:serine hydrolase [Vicinamibacterales bacterium]
MQLLLWFALALAADAQGGGKPSPMQTQAIEAAIRGFDGVVGVAAKNLATGEELVVNGDMPFPTASTIKTAVMLEAWHQAADGVLSLDTVLTLRESDKVGGSGVLNGLSDGLALKVRDLVHLMIVLSDNTATNMLVNRLGTKNIDERLVAYGLTRTKIFRPTFRDGKPDVFPELEREFGLGMSTPREMAALMALIADGRAVSAEASAAMLATLRRQQDRAMIPRLLPGSLQVGNKTGIDSEKLADARGRRGGIRADAAIVVGEKVRYVIAIFVRRARDTRSGVDNEAVLLGAKLSRMVYDHFSR